MTRPPSGEWPAGPAGSDDADDRDLLGADDLWAIRAELTRGARPAPSRLREWVVAAADAERTRPPVRSLRPDANGREPSLLHPIGSHGSTIPARGQKADAMSDRTVAGIRLASHPGSARLAERPRPSGLTRRSVAQRWSRHGWPILELLGAAALIVGLVSVMVGGGNGGLPGLVPGFGQTTREATPLVDVPADAVAMAQGNAGRTGEMPGPGVLSDPARLWRVPIAVEDGEVPWDITGNDAGVVSAGGTTLFVERAMTSQYVGQSRAGQVTLHAVDARDGTERWQTAFNGVFQGQPLLADGLVVVAIDLFQTSSAADGPDATPRSNGDAQPGLVLALDAATGAERWRTSLGPVGTQDPMYHDGVIYLIDNVGTPYGLDIRTGAVVWSGANIPPVGGDSFSPYGVIFSSVAIAGGHLIVTSASGFTYAYDLDDVDVAWVWPDPGTTDPTQIVASNVLGLGPVASGGRVYLLTADNPSSSSLVVVDLLSGAELWRQPVGERQFRPGVIAVTDEVVLDVTDAYPGSTIRAFSADRGNTLWTLSTAQPVNQAPTIVGELAYVAGSDGTVTAYQLRDGQQVWQVRAGNAIASPIYVAGGVVSFASYDGYVYAIGGSGGSGTTEDAARMRVVDVSGLPPCNVSPRPPVQTVPGPAGNGTSAVPALDATPRLSLPGTDDEDDAYGNPTIGWSDLPAGGAPSSEQASAISQILTMLKACARPGNGAYIAAFYTDDYFLRPTNTSDLAQYGYGALSAPTGLSTPADVTAYGRVLPDGRVALVEYSASERGAARVAVLAEQPDGRWLIDEVAQITVSGRSRQG